MGFYKDMFSQAYQMYKDKQRQEIQAGLFLNKTQSDYFGHILLFQKFGTSGAQTYSKKSQITTHYMENNTATQDHWAIEPVRLTVSGLIGEVVFTVPDIIKDIQNSLSQASNKLTPLGRIAPSFDSYTRKAIALTQLITNSITRYIQIAQNLLDKFFGGVKRSNQYEVITMLEELIDKRQLVTLYTPYGEYINLAIESINATQNETKYQSNLEIQFIQWREVKTETRDATREEKEYFAKCQSAETQQLGNASTTNKSTFATRYDKGENLIQGLK